MKLYKTTQGTLLHVADGYYRIDQDWDQLVNRDSLYGYLSASLKSMLEVGMQEAERWIANELLPPIGNQEVWAAGVTYFRSMEARMEEAKESGGADLYDKVYHAERPELFFKATPNRVVGHGGAVSIRKDSMWDVPEPELTLFINSHGIIQGYTIGNDMSSRSIEGENALYLPQAKVYDRSAALGPCLYVPESTIDPETTISMQISRAGNLMFSDSVKISRIKRSLEELAGYLYRECRFVYGSYLMTGTCLVPANDFTLAPDDEVNITIEPIGTLSNTVGYN
ncbi:2-hydroxyhepta-2,4-diene-1,7-dioate isomerase [Parapedobacter pyrenivorans]|uniref:2-hydroxyhepta-2,4-diene-1,7-dioate isomerase n=1 Tax=Parapedobacter pyrenivorans TaxID=1305674 RepID=A0A917HWF6_9SPHI|nr:fumarylacetoacetate hydrolase family protein [Parapedobacter pyrenivorans]GGG92230.1 2-hydroxyhepta-2,4-diene-1,7-dioate isomerase [Parapedobacter pyrenivorans]